MGLNLKVVLTWRNIYIENIGAVSQMGGLKREENIKMEGSQGPL